MKLIRVVCAFALFPICLSGCSSIDVDIVLDYLPKEGQKLLYHEYIGGECSSSQVWEIPDDWPDAEFKVSVYDYCITPDQFVSDGYREQSGGELSGEGRLKRGLGSVELVILGQSIYRINLGSDRDACRIQSFVDRAANAFNGELNCKTTCEEGLMASDAGPDQNRVEVHANCSIDDAPRMRWKASGVFEQDLGVRMLENRGVEKSALVFDPQIGKLVKKDVTQYSYKLQFVAEKTALLISQVE